jgi:hypothetical protein
MVWSALEKYAKLECRSLCVRVTALPRELSDPIYEHILEGTNQDLAANCITDRANNRRWWKREPYLDLDTVGADFLRELMETYYSTAPFEFGVQKLQTPVDFNLWSLLAKDVFNSTCVPARLVKNITIDLGMNNRLDVSRCRFLEPGSGAKRIEGATCRVVISAAYPGNRYCKSRSALGQDGLMRRLDRALTRLTALGIDVQLFSKGRLLYPNQWKEEKLEMDRRRQVMHLVVWRCGV